MGKASMLKAMKKLKITQATIENGPTSLTLKNEKGEPAQATLSIDRKQNVVLRFGKFPFGKKYLFSLGEFDKA